MVGLIAEKNGGEIMEERLTGAGGGDWRNSRAGNITNRIYWKLQEFEDVMEKFREDSIHKLELVLYFYAIQSKNSPPKASDIFIDKINADAKRWEELKNRVRKHHSESFAKEEMLNIISLLEKKEG